MAITTLPTQDESSLGQVKTDTAGPYVAATDVKAALVNEWVTRLVELFSEVGKSDGTTADSINAKIGAGVTPDPGSVLGRLLAGEFSVASLGGGGTSTPTTPTVVVVDTATSCSVQLPDPATVSAQHIFLLIVDASNNALVKPIALKRWGAELIDFVAANKSLDISGGRWLVWTNGVNWYVHSSYAGHGALAGGTLHADAVAATSSGFMTGADKSKLDGVTAGADVTPAAISVIAPAAAGASVLMSGNQIVGATSLVSCTVGTDPAGEPADLSGGPYYLHLSDGTNSEDVIVVARPGGGGDPRTISSPLQHAYNAGPGTTAYAGPATSPGVAGLLSALDAVQLAALPTNPLRADGSVSLTGNLIVSAGVTVDGRDVSVDGGKLDGIAVGATVGPALASTTPAAVGTAAPGTTGDASDAGHVHAFLYVTRAVAANDTILSTDALILLTSGAVARTLTLPAHSAGLRVLIMDATGEFDAYPVTLARAGGTGSIQGLAASYVYSVPWGCIELVSDGTGWYILRG